MRSKMELKEAKKQYDENVARAHEASELASELRASFENRQKFNSDDNKKLERVEKLTRKIRSEAGGSEGDPDASDIPAGVGATIKQIAEVAEEMSKLVEKTPRHVISAAVIDQANKLISLIRYFRNSSR